MPGTRRGIYIEFVGDELKYVRSAENVMATNTKLGTSFRTVGVDATKGAEAQVAAALAANKALKEQAANLRLIASTSTGEKQAAAIQLATQAEAQLARQQGLTAASTAAMSAKVKEGERDIGKFARGAAAGSGLVAGLGRSLAFASAGFIAIAGGATLLRRSVDAAISLAATQRQVDEQLKTSGKSWADYGDRITAVNLKISHYAGYTNQELLQSFGYLVRVSGNVQTALRLNAVAADVARGRHIGLANASLALGKALGGSITALRRLGIVVPQNVKGMAALNYVAQKFAGQAKAGATIGDKFNATLVDSEEIIGTALLPSITRLLTSLGGWLQKMNESGRLQKDVNGIMRDAGDIAHVVGEAIGTLDKVTGSFANTLKLIVEIKFAMRIAGWISYLGRLASGWTAVEVAATGAAAAEARALGAGAAGGAGLAAGETTAVSGLAGGGLLAGFLRGRTPIPTGGARFVAGTSAENTIDTSVIGPVTQAEAKVVALRSSLLGLGALTIAPIAIPILLNVEGRFNQATQGSWFQRHLGFFTHPPIHPLASAQAAQQNLGGGGLGNMFALWGRLIRGQSMTQALAQMNYPGVPFPPGFNPRYNTLAPRAFQLPGFGPFGGFYTMRGRNLYGAQPGGFPGVQAQPQWTGFQERAADVVAQARAALTTSSKDDLAAARKALAWVKKKIDEGNLSSKAMAEALQLEGTLLGQINQAESDAAAKRAAAWQHAHDRAQKALENMIDPIKLEVALSREQATGGDTTATLKAMLASARKALASGKLNFRQQKEAWDQIRSIQDAMKQQTQAVMFQLPARLALRLARDQALGLSTRDDLLKARAAILKFIRTHRKNIAAVTDAYNQLAGINQQLTQGLNEAQAALGLFKQVDLKKLTAGITDPDQRRRIMQQLSQLGPKRHGHYTTPGTGTGAAGYAINPDTGRPIILKLDGKVVARSTTKHQQSYRGRNPSQRRGPHAGETAA